MECDSIDLTNSQYQASQPQLNHASATHKHVNKEATWYNHFTKFDPSRNGYARSFGAYFEVAGDDSIHKYRSPDVAITNDG